MAALFLHSISLHNIIMVTNLKLSQFLSILKIMRQKKFYLILKSIFEFIFLKVSQNSSSFLGEIMTVPHLP